MNKNEEAVEHAENIRQEKRNAALAWFCLENVYNPLLKNISSYSYHQEENQEHILQSLEIYEKRDYATKNNVSTKLVYM